MHLNADKAGISPVVAVIQARMGSTRLAGKVMKEICGKPILWHVVNRLKACTRVEKIIVATTTDPSDNVIESWCWENGVQFYRGSIDDVLDRYYQAARQFGAKTIIRITADCPLLDPRLVDGIIEKFSGGSFDHVGVDGTHPDGLDAEVFSFSAIERAHREASLASEREHVTPYIWKNPGRFRLSSITCRENLSHLRWTVDDEKDFTLVTKIYEGINGKGNAADIFHMEDILGFLGKNPDICAINSNTARNEGYAKSLRQDRVVKAV